MTTVHMTLQGKGGVGKSFVASLLAQHFTERDCAPLCFDTDPVNQTFAGYRRFNVEVIRLGLRPDEIDPRNFDTLIEKILQAPEDATTVIDSGAATSGRGLLADPRWRRYLAIRQNTLSTSQARNWRLYLTGQATADPMAINMVDAIGKVFGKGRGRGR